MTAPRDEGAKHLPDDVAVLVANMREQAGFRSNGDAMLLVMGADALEREHAARLAAEAQVAELEKFVAPFRALGPTDGEMLDI